MYVGETKNPLKSRFARHYNDIRKHKDTPVSRHFNQEDHDIQDVQVQGIAKVNKPKKSQEEIDIIRLNLERKLIEKLDTLTPNGINVLSDKKADNRAVLTIPFSEKSQTLGNKLKIIVREELNEDIIVAYKRHKNLKEYLCPSREI